MFQIRENISQGLLTKCCLLMISLLTRYSGQILLVCLPYYSRSRSECSGRLPSIRYLITHNNNPGLLHGRAVLRTIAKYRQYDLYQLADDRIAHTTASLDLIGYTQAQMPKLVSRLLIYCRKAGARLEEAVYDIHGLER